MPQANATFTVDTHVQGDPPLVGEDAGVEYGRALLSKTFRGELEATGQVEMLSTRAGAAGGYVAIERIEGTLKGRHGSFALLHLATRDGARQSTRWAIAPGSGTGELSGISGEATIEIATDGGHSLTVDYELPT